MICESRRRTNSRRPRVNIREVRTHTVPDTHYLHTLFTLLYTQGLTFPPTHFNEIKMLIQDVKKASFFFKNKMGVMEILNYKHKKLFTNYLIFSYNPLKYILIFYKINYIIYEI